MRGTIKKLVADRGFGFITGEDGADYFFHRDDLREGLDLTHLKAGDVVSFEAASRPKGPRAVEVRTAA